VQSARRDDDVFGADRSVYKLDLFEHPPAEAADTLNRYCRTRQRRLVRLGFARARGECGEALETAQREYETKNAHTDALSAK
jgi:hypothetical protein